MSVINDSKFKKSILSALADEDMIQIIKHTTDNPISGNDIIKLCNIPHSTAYRKLKLMLEEGLIAIAEIKFTEDGKKFTLFQSTVHSINVNMEKNGIMTVTALKNIGAKQFTAKKFLSIDME
ncbi:MAG: winged helix-turn-helix transcriptional regulator [Nitrosopumilus sp.]|nr:winged helix-turn-helix transcriptional regulator [Nitrosopumilus sp.]